jgi:hypothetical protein
MALPISVTYTFATATSAIPLSQLDANFTTVVNGINGIGNGTNSLSNVSITGGTITGLSSAIPVASGGTGVTSVGTSGNVLTSNGTAWVSQASTVSVDTGTIVSSAASSAPSGYLACDGSTYLKSSYSALSTVIGQAPTLVPSYNSNLSAATPVYYVNGNLINYSKYSTNGGATWSNIGTNNISTSNLAQGNWIWTGTYYVNGGANGGNGIAYRTTLAGAGTSVTTNINYSVYGLAWNGSNLAVAGGPGSTTLSYSANGISWTAGASLGAGGTCYDIAYGNSVFVIAGRNTANGVSIWTTTNGTAVTLQTLPAGFTSGAAYVYTLNYANGLFIAVNNLGAVASSPDGVTWTLKAAAYTLIPIFNSITGPYLFLTSSTTTSQLPISRIVYCNGLYFSGQAYSSDLITWKLIPPFQFGTSITSLISASGFCGTDGTTVFISGYTGQIGCTTLNSQPCSFVPYNYTTATQFVVPNINSLSSPNQYYYIKT